MRPAGRGILSLLAMDEGGTPLAGAEFLLSAGTEAIPASADDRGSARFEGLPPGGYRVEARIGEMTFGAISKVSVGDGEEKRLAARCCGTREGAIEGRTVDAGGNPLMGVAIRIEPEAGDADVLNLWPGPRTPLSVESDPAGSFLFPGPGSGPFRLVASRPGRGWEVSRAVTSPCRDVDLVFEADRALVLRGRCMDRDGRPVEGARVAVLGIAGASALSDERGDYTIDLAGGPATGSLLVLASSPGFASQQRSIEVDAASRDLRLDLVLRPVSCGGEVVGTLQDAAGTAVPNHKVFLQSPTALTSLEATSDSGGTFVFPDLATSDDYVLTVYPRSGYEVCRMPGIAVGADSPVFLEAVLKPKRTATVEGTVLDPRGNPIPGAAFRIASAGNPYCSKTVLAAGDGSFRAEVESGQLIFVASGIPDRSVTGFRAGPEDANRVELIFGDGDLCAKGRISAKDGRALAGIRISLFWYRESDGLRSHLQSSTVSDRDGAYRFTRLPPGKYTVLLFREGALLQTATRSLAEDDGWDFIVPAD